MLKDLVSVFPVTQEQIKEFDNKTKNDSDRKIINTDSNLLYGIFYKNKIVGLANPVKWYPNNLTINIFIQNEYRGNGIAPIAIEKIVELCGKENTHISRFMYNVSSNNTSSIRVAEKLGWSETLEYDEDMINEGAEFFRIFYKNNPYYEKGMVKKYDKK